jgi:cytochrome P450
MTTADQYIMQFPLPSSDSIYDPAAELGQLREHAPVARVKTPDGQPTWLVTGHAEVRRVLTDPRFSRAKAVAGGASAELSVLTTETLISMDPPEHTRLRKLLAHAFSQRQMARLRPRVATLVNQLLDDLIAGPPPADLIERFSMPLPLHAISELLGVPQEYRVQCTIWTATMLGTGQQDSQLMQEALDGFASIIAGKRAEPDDGLISALIAARDQHDRLSERELLTVTVALVLGGHETTTHVINLSLLTLLRYPDQMALLRSNPAILPTAVEELVRFIQLGGRDVLLPRIATEDIELGGVTVPAGDALMCAWTVANRDPAAFPDPDRLDPTRIDNPHLGFGAGVHHCVGAQMGRLILHEALHGLLQRLPRLELAVPVSELRFKPDQFLRSLECLPVSW